MTTEHSTSRLRFELLREDHVELLFGLHSDPEVMRFISAPEVDRDETWALIARVRLGMEKVPGVGLYLAFEKSGGAFIGWGMVKAFDQLDPAAIEVGYRLHKFAWGKGYATEISEYLIGIVFGKMGRDRVVAVTDPAHLASQRVLEKVGFTRNGNIQYYGEDTFFFERRRGLRFLEYRPEYRSAFVILNLEWLERHFVVEASDEIVLRDPEGTILAGGGKILFAELDGKIVGTGSLIRTDAEEFELAKMAVTEATQGRGVGSLLIAALISAARKAGAKRLHLISNSKLAPALHLYRKHGFVSRPILDEDRAAYARCDVRLELKINP